MASRVALAATFASGCSAFVPPTGYSLRASHSQTNTATSGSVTHSASAPVTGALCATSLASAAAAVAVLSAKKTSSGTHRALRVQRNAKEPPMVGVVLPLTEKWDPLDLGGNDTALERYTEAEIKHGRVAMLATLGYFVPYAFHFPGCETFDNGLGALSTVPTLGWLQIVALIGAHEILIKPRDGGFGPWDFGFGTEIYDNLPSEEEKIRRQNVERSNGRLAMVAIVGLFVQEMMLGDPIESLAAQNKIPLY